MMLGSYDKDKGKVIELDKAQVTKIAETYEDIIGKSSKRQTSCRTQECIQINVTLPDNRKEEMMFRNSEDYQQIAQRIMNKYAIPSQKLRNIENIIQSKLKQK
jgi:serine kinase of HPr protein (carbohydrate metabolism regulator)